MDTIALNSDEYGQFAVFLHELPYLWPALFLAVILLAGILIAVVFTCERIVVLDRKWSARVVDSAPRGKTKAFTITFDDGHGQSHDETFLASKVYFGNGRMWLEDGDGDPVAILSKDQILSVTAL
jgi:hypothetical protein